MWFYFADGPCAGQKHFEIQEPDRGEILPCGFHFYEFLIDGKFHDIGMQDPRDIGTGSLGTGAPKGWHDLQQSVNHHLPTVLRQTRRLRLATMRTIARRRRLR